MRLLDRFIRLEAMARAPGANLVGLKPQYTETWLRHFHTCLLLDIP